LKLVFNCSWQMFKSVAKGGDESGRKNRRGWGQNARCMKSGKSGKSGACVGALSYQHGMQFSKLSIFYANSLAFHNALRFALLLSIFPQPRPHFSRGRGQWVQTGHISHIRRLRAKKAVVVGTKNKKPVAQTCKCVA